jgi:hypothetical protein
MSKNGPQIVSLNPPVRNASRLAGLGRVTSPSEIASLPESIDYRFLFDVGTPADTLQKLFGPPEVDIAAFAQRFAPAGVAFNTSNLSSNQVSCPFLALAVCVQVDADDYAYSLTGQIVPRSTTLPKTDVPALYAASNLSGPTRPAVFTKGYDSWKAKAAFMKTFGLRMVLGCNYELFEMPLLLIGEDSQTDSNGFGSGVLNTTSDIACGNRLLTNLGQNAFFAPQNAVAPCTDGGVGNVLPPATAPVQWGQPRYPGQYQGCFPLPNRFVLVPAMPYSLYLTRQVNTDEYYADFINALSGSTTPQCFAENVNELIAQQNNFAEPRTVTFRAWTTTDGSSGPYVDITAGDPIVSLGGPELVRFGYNGAGQLVPYTIYGGVLNPTATPPGASFEAGQELPPADFDVISNEQFIGYACAQSVKCGKLNIIISIRGFILTLKAALDYYINYTATNERAREMYGASNNALAGAALKAGFRDGLSGVGETMSLEEAKKLVERVRD